MRVCVLVSVRASACVVGLGVVRFQTSMNEHLHETCMRCNSSCNVCSNCRGIFLLPNFVARQFIDCAPLIRGVICVSVLLVGGGGGRALADKYVCVWWQCWVIILGKQAIR